MTDVIRINVSLTDINRFAEMDAICREYFSEPYPTRNTVGVKELWGGAQVGFDVWAVVDAETMLMSAILEHIQDHEAIDLTRQLIRIPSFLWRGKRDRALAGRLDVGARLRCRAARSAPARRRRHPSSDRHAARRRQRSFADASVATPIPATGMAMSSGATNGVTIPSRPRLMMG